MNTQRNQSASAPVRRRRRIAAGSAVALCAISLVPAAAGTTSNAAAAPAGSDTTSTSKPMYTVVDIKPNKLPADVPAGSRLTGSFIQALAPNGTVLGTATYAGDGWNGARSFVRSVDGRVRWLPVTAGKRCALYPGPAINSAGIAAASQACTNRKTGKTIVRAAVVDSKNRVTVLPLTKALRRVEASYVTDINERGDVLGSVSLGERHAYGMRVMAWPAKGGVNVGSGWNEARITNAGRLIGTDRSYQVVATNGLSPASPRAWASRKLSLDAVAVGANGKYVLGSRGNDVYRLLEGKRPQRIPALAGVQVNGVNDAGTLIGTRAKGEWSQQIVGTTSGVKPLDEVLDRKVGTVSASLIAENGYIAALLNPTVEKSDGVLLVPIR